MKRIYWLPLLAVLALLGSCKTNQVAGLDLTDGNYKDDFTYILSVNGTTASLTTPWGPWNHTLKINGRQFDWPDVINDEPYVHYLYEDIFGQFTAMEDTVNYEFAKNGITFTGTLIQPEIPLLSLPELDEGRDYRFTWTSETNPQYYVISILALDDTPDLAVQVPGTLRSFIVDRDFWAGDSYVIFRVVIKPVNYVAHDDDLLAISSFSIGDWVAPPEKAQGIKQLTRRRLWR